MQASKHLQARAVDDLHVDSELLTVVVEDEDTDGTTAGLESVLQTRVEVGLVNDGQAGLDVAGLGHGSDDTLGHVKDAVLLEDRAEHGLDDDAGGGVGDEGRLLVQLLGEEVNTEVAVLASGRGGGDADDLARAALEHQEVTHANVVARDGDGVGQVGLSRVAGARVRTRGGRTLLHLVVVNVGLGRVGRVRRVTARVGDLVSELVNARAEGVVVAVLVVVTHVGLLIRARHVGGSRFNGLVRLVLELMRSAMGLDVTTFYRVVNLDTVGLVMVELLLRKTRRSVNGSREGRLVVVVVVMGTEVLSVLTFSNVKGA